MGLEGGPERIRVLLRVTTSVWTCVAGPGVLCVIFFLNWPLPRRSILALLGLLMFPNLITIAELPSFLDIGAGGVQLFGDAAVSPRVEGRLPLLHGMCMGGIPETFFSPKSPSLDPKVEE